MARLPYPDLTQVSDTVRAEVGDNPPNVTRMLAGASEAVFNGFGAFGRALIGGSPLPPKLREIAILRVGYISNAKYELFQHEAFGRFVGLSEEQLAAVKSGDTASPALDETERAVLAFAEDLVVNVRASDATLDAVRRHLGDSQVIDLIMVTGAYMMVCRLLETTGVELDAVPIDWDAMTSA